MRRGITLPALAPGCAVLAWLLSGCTAPGHGGSPSVPVDDPAHERIRRLDAAGLVQSSVTGIRGVSRKEIARGITEAQWHLELLGPGLGESFDILYEAYLPEILAGAIGLDHTGPHAGFVPEALDVSFVFSEGPVKPVNQVVYAGQEDVSGFNNYGRIDTGPGVRVTPRLHWRLGDHASVTFRPEVTGMKDTPWDREVRLLEANVRLFAGSLELEYGTDSLWWGPGRHGSLLLSNNAPPFRHMWRLGTHEPILLPGRLNRWLGPTSFSVFGARLDDRTGLAPWLGGMRLEFRVRPNWTLGFSRTAIVGGERTGPYSGPVDLGLLWDVFVGDDENVAGGGPSDQKAGADLRYRNAAFVQPFEVYFEVHGEDQANYKPSRPAYLAGLYLPRFGGSGTWGTIFDLLVEYASTHVPGHEDYWYTHPPAYDFESGGATYPAYTYDTFWMGHHMGTDADDFFVKLGFTPARRGESGRAGARRYEVAFDRERHHLSGTTATHPGGVEAKDEWTFRMLWDHSETSTLSVAARFQEWRNFDETEGAVERTSCVECRATFRF